MAKKVSKDFRDIIGWMAGASEAFPTVIVIEREHAPAEQPAERESESVRAARQHVEECGDALTKAVGDAAIVKAGRAYRAASKKLMAAELRALHERMDRECVHLADLQRQVDELSGGGDRGYENFDMDYIEPDEDEHEGEAEEEVANHG